MHQSLGAAVGAHKPLRSYKINFQEAKTTREERTHSGAVDLRRENPLQTQILTGARTASRSRSLHSQAQGQRGADLNSDRRSWLAKGEHHRTGTNNFKICMEKQKTLKSQNNLEKKEHS